MKPTPFYQSPDGAIVLYCADCRDVLPRLGTVDAIVADPPYGIGFAAQPTTGGRKRGQASETWDDETHDEVLALPGMAPICAIWGGNYYPLPISRGWLSWYKPDSPPSMGDFELAWTNADQNAESISHSIAATNPERVGHPTQKPVRVIIWTMEQLNVPKGATVLDPYMGSGTTAIACIRTGRKFIGVEISPEYCAIARDRIIRELAQPCLPFARPETHSQPDLLAK